MADSTNPVSSAIVAASATLKTAFGENTKVEGDNQFRYLQEKYLTDLYLTELNEKDIAAFFSDIPASVGKMRSTYLPTDLVQQVSLSLGSVLGETISSSSATKESYENAFMRMMGMPSSDSISYGTNDISVVTSKGEEILLSYDDVERQILDERQTPRISRKVLITNKTYNLSDSEYEDESYNNPEVEPDADQNPLIFISAPEVQEELADDGEPNIAEIENNLYNYCYLLIPPIQDGRISQCINESSKIVPSNFSNKRGHRINSNELHTSMLESIIRIRKDKLSGRSDFSSVDIDGEEQDLTTDDYGVLESLFIIRLKSALGALAQKMSNDIDLLAEVYEQTGRIPISKNLVSKTTTTGEDPGVAADHGESAEGSGEIVEDNNQLYKDQKVIEDSMMALLDDNSEVLDLQVQTQRNSSIKDAHVMSSLIGIIDLPRQRLREKIRVESIDRDDITDGDADKCREVLDTIIGTSKGIGAVDILVFILALFTMPEDHLTGLLSDLEYQKYLDEFAGAGDTGGIFGSIGSSDGLSKVETLQAVNKLTEYILSGYNLFKADLGKSDSGHGEE